MTCFSAKAALVRGGDAPRGVLSSTDLNFLSPTLVSSLVLMVNATEVGNDDGNRQSNDQHPTEGTDGAKDLPCYGLWDHVSIPAEKEQEIETLVIEICTTCFYTCSFLFNRPAALKKSRQIHDITPTHLKLLVIIIFHLFFIITFQIMNNRKLLLKIFVCFYCILALPHAT